MKVTPDLVDSAHIFAASKHKGQKYGEQDYYSYHLCGVLDEYKALYPNYAPYEEIAVILHDVVEDTDATVEEIEVAFGNKVSGIVDSMSKRPSETYEHYLMRVLRNPAAVKVKRADASFNLNESIKSKRVRGIAKYRNVLELLK